MEEQWKPWDVDSRFNKKYSIESMIDDTENFRIKLFETMSERNDIELVFPDSVIAYCSTDESFRQQTIENLHQCYGGEFYANTTFFWIENSKYLKKIQEESYGVYSQEGLMHFCIMAGDSFVDIITTYEPEIHIL